ncbi:hypothetical protein [Thauera aromatica]|uniref:Uncharacterized protein n=1 Tax=Thauera aromatica K172 TaxID=44139 RepID=A0A2R4BNV4_THAAR|nr:hypothetical protein [Thauera aromatica]AVR89027.1 hypothetical protein Tharo_2124 [Thauera aromatica K172]
MNPREMRHKATIAAYGALKAAGGWVCAIEAAELARKMLAERVQLYAWPPSYRPIAFGLRRLVLIGEAQERIVIYRGSARSKEERREYRLSTIAEQAHPCPALFPTVMPVPAGAPRRVVRMED